jgi:hypothetical protein
MDNRPLDAGAVSNGDGVLPGAASENLEPRRTRRYTKGNMTDKIFVAFPVYEEITLRWVVFDSQTGVA